MAPQTFSPRIEVSATDDADRLSTYTSSRAASREHLPSNHFVRRRSPSPTPGSSRPPSPSAPQPVLAVPLPPPTNTRVSFSSDASSMTLSGRDGTRSPEVQNVGSVLGGPVTAEPEGITASPPVVEPKVYLSPAPVSFVSNLRYKRRETIDYTKLEGFSTIPARNRLSSRSNWVGTLGWQPHIHPEGSLYFTYKNFYTNVYLYDEANLRVIEKTVELITKELDTQGVPMDDLDIGLEIHIDEDNDTLGCYYLCDRKEEEAFWLSDCDEGFWTDALTVKILGKEHLKLAAGAAYCSSNSISYSIHGRDHVFMFPHGHELTFEGLDQLHSELCYYIIDKETSKTSTAPYSADDLHRFLQITKDIPIPKEGVPGRPEHVVLVARIKAALARERFIRYYGERFAQLDSDRSVYESDRKNQSGWFRCLSWMFFFTPQIYLDRLAKVWVDEKVNYQQWRKFIGELQEDWTASITPATVVLTTNVGFLAIQSVDQNGVASADRTAGQIVSYVSTMLSIGNIIACVILARQHRPSSHFYAEDAVAYLSGRARTPGGLEKLAVIFSIPTAFFIWALLTFFIAVSWVCFHDTSVITRTASGATVALSSILLGGIVHNGDWTAAPADPNTLSSKMQRLGRLVKKAPSRAARRLSTFSRRMSELRFPSPTLSVGKGMPRRLRSIVPASTSPHGSEKSFEAQKIVSPSQPQPQTLSYPYDEKRASPQFSTTLDGMV